VKFGFVSLIGRPNAGKSTLVNRLVGSKLAIVSDKPQTTRTRILGVRNYPDAAGHQQRSRVDDDRIDHTRNDELGDAALRTGSNGSCHA